MGKIVADTQTIASTPASGTVVLHPLTATKGWVSRDDTGKMLQVPYQRNFSTAQQSIATNDTYITGSSITVPAGLALQVGTTFRWHMGITRSGAGTAAPVWVIRIGTLGTTSDAAICTFTSAAAQTNNADNALITIVATLRNVGAAGVLAGHLQMNHNLSATGVANIAGVSLSSVSAGFVTTTAGLIIGVSVNPGASSTWLHEVVHVEALGM